MLFRLIAVRSWLQSGLNICNFSTSNFEWTAVWRKNNYLFVCLYISINHLILPFCAWWFGGSTEHLNLVNDTSLKSSEHASVRMLFRLIAVRCWLLSGLNVCNFSTSNVERIAVWRKNHNAVFLHLTFSRDLVTRPDLGHPKRLPYCLKEAIFTKKESFVCQLEDDGIGDWTLYASHSKQFRIWEDSPKKWIMDNLIFAWWIQTFYFGGHDTRCSANNTTLEKKMEKPCLIWCSLWVRVSDFLYNSALLQLS